MGGLLQTRGLRFLGCRFFRVETGKFVHLLARRDPGEEAGNVVAKSEGVEAGKGGEGGLELAKSFAELALGAEAIVALVVVEADGEVDQGLQEETLGATRGGPDLFEHFVALEEVAAVEQVEAAAEERGVF